MRPSASQNNFSWLKLDLNPFFAAKKPALLQLVGYNILHSSSSTNQNAALIMTTSWILLKWGSLFNRVSIEFLEWRYTVSDFWGGKVLHING